MNYSLYDKNLEPDKLLQQYIKIRSLTNHLSVIGDPPEDALRDWLVQTLSFDFLLWRKNLRVGKGIVVAKTKKGIRKCKENIPDEKSLGNKGQVDVFVYTEQPRAELAGTAILCPEQVRLIFEIKGSTRLISEIKKKEILVNGVTETKNIRSKTKVIEDAFDQIRTNKIKCPKCPIYVFFVVCKPIMIDDVKEICKLYASARGHGWTDLPNVIVVIDPNGIHVLEIDISKATITERVEQQAITPNTQMVDEAFEQIKSKIDIIGGNTEGIFVQGYFDYMRSLSALSGKISEDIGKWPDR